MPGDNIEVTMNLNFPLVVESGLRFSLREGGKTIAAGVITKVLPDDPVVAAAAAKKWDWNFLINLFSFDF